MQINSINNNQPNFGIKYVNKSAWNREVLRTFENSTLLKEIDKKFPEATVAYSKSYKFKPNNYDKIHTLMINFQLAEGYGYKWTLSSSKEEEPDKMFQKFVNEKKLDSLEFSADSQKTK